MRFVSGREALMLPEVFETDVHSAGKCRRIQVVSHAVLASWIKIRQSQTMSIPLVAFWALFSPHHVPQLQIRNVCARSKQVPGSAASCLAARRFRQADIYTLPKLPVQVSQSMNGTQLHAVIMSGAGQFLESKWRVFILLNW